MFNVNDVVIYGTEGICTIVDITEKNFGNETGKYYILSPLGKEANTVYVPMHNEKILLRMRKVFTPAEANDFLHSLPEEGLAWIVNERERQKGYKDILLYGKPDELFTMIRSLYDKQDEQTRCGKKLHASDERYLRDAERMLFEEIAYAISIKPSEVLPLIIKIEREKKRK